MPLMVTNACDLELSYSRCSTQTGHLKHRNTASVQVFFRRVAHRPTSLGSLLPTEMCSAASLDDVLLYSASRFSDTFYIH